MFKIIHHSYGVSTQQLFDEHPVEFMYCDLTNHSFSIGLLGIVRK